MKTTSDVNEILDDLSVLDVEALSVALELPSIPGVGVRPFGDMDPEDSAAAMLHAMRGLVARGYVRDLGDDRFAVEPATAQVISAAAWPLTVLRVVTYVGGGVESFFFVYAREGVSIVHEIGPSGRHRLIPKSLASACDDLVGLLSHLVEAEDGEERAIVLPRRELMSAAPGTGDAEIAEILARARATAASGYGIRVDLGDPRFPENGSLYVALLGGPNVDPWVLSGVGLDDEALVTCAPATKRDLRGALKAMLEASSVGGSLREARKPSSEAAPLRGSD